MSTKPPAWSAGSVTIYDVAIAAGVSTATVSHVFSGRQPVSPAAAEKVLAVAAELGYQANATARALATGRSFVVALHVAADTGDLVLNPFFASVVMTVSNRASTEGYALMLLPPDQADAREHVEMLIRDRRIDGVLLIDPGPADEFVEALEAAEIPFVSIGRIEGRPEHAWVDGDVRRQVSDALDHLAERGYRAPALFTLPGQSSFLREAQDGYVVWCDESGARPMVITSETLTEDAAFRCIDALEAHDFDALHCVHDMLASGAQRLMRSVGRAVGIVGTGDSFYASHATPPLTSLATNAIERGERATGLLLALVEDREPVSRQIVVPHRLVARDSSPPVQAP